MGLFPFYVFVRYLIIPHIDQYLGMSTLFAVILLKEALCFACYVSDQLL